MQKSEKNDILRRKISAALPMFLIIFGSIAVSLLAFWGALELEKNFRKQSFKQEASNIGVSIQIALDQNIQSLESITALYNSSEVVNRQEFQKFVQFHLRNNPALQALEWVPRISSDQREAYEVAARQEGFTNFQITERDAQGEVKRAGLREEYFPVYFVEPFQGNEIALGFDIASNPSRLKTLNQSRDQGKAIATVPIELVQKTRDEQKGFLVFSPIFKKNQPIDSVQARRKHLEGFALSVFLIEDLMTGVLQFANTQGYDFFIFDPTLPQNEQFLYASSSSKRQKTKTIQDINTLKKGFFQTTTLKLAERQWLLIAKPNADSLTTKSSGFPLLILTSGGFLVIGFIAYNNNQHRVKLQLQKTKETLSQRIQERTSALELSNQKLILEMEERKQTETQIYEMTQRLELATNSAQIGVWDLDLIRDQLIWDNRMYELYGLKAEEFGGAYEAWKLGVHPDDLPAADADIQAAIRGEREFHPEFRVKWPNGKVRYIQAHAIVLRDETGKAQRMIGVNWDITENKQAEESLHQLNEELETKVQQRTEQLEERAQALEQSNAELQQFAYVASHDLQEPLRTISSYTELLAEEYGDRLGQEADEYMDFIVDGASRMQQLIKDLLTFSRLGTRGKVFAPFSSESVLQKVLTNLKIAIEECDAIVTHDVLPIITGDESQIQQLFQNLISNAIKFRGKSPPKIHISVVSHDQEIEFCIQDNGIGIEPEYFDQIFEIFQRLHTRRKYDGTGIGLAICRKIVQRHGGRIWVHSTLGTGASFYFTIPNYNISDNDT